MAKSVGFTDADVPDQSGKTFLITGANTGIGFETTRVLAARGARVLLACRDTEKATAAIARIRKETPRANLAFLPLDQSDLASVRAAAKAAESEPRIDVLINNAGVMASSRRLTKQGFELQFGVNHIGCFALTGLLLPKLMETPQSRVVVTGSGLHKKAEIDWDDLNADKNFNGMARYGASKLANMLFFFELDRRLRAAGSSTAAVGGHPGVAGTSVMRDFPMAPVMMPIVRLLLNTAAKGAWGPLQAATGHVSSGSYYGPTGMSEMRGPSGESHPADHARDPVSAKKLWDLSIEMSGVDPGLAP